MKIPESIILNRASTLVLRSAIIAIGIAALAFCAFAIPSLWVGVEGEHADIEFALRALLLLMASAAVPFLVALSQGLRLLGYIDKNKAFSKLSVARLKNIAICAFAISLIYIVGLPFFYILADQDDAPGLVIVGMIMVAAPLVVAIFATVLQRLLRQALEIKSENDLTV